MEEHMNTTASVPMSNDPIIFRGLLRPDLLRGFTSLVRDSYSQLDQQASDQGILDDDLRSAYAWGAIGVPSLKGHFAGFSILNEVQATIQRAIPGARFNDGLSTIRRFRSSSEHLSWHIDADGVGTSRIDPCFNAWCTLSPVGLASPSLELIPNSDKKMRQLPLLPPTAASRDDAWRRKHFPGAVF